MKKRLLISAIAVTAVLVAAGAEAAAGTSMCVDLLKTKKVTFEHGPTTAYIFNMNGKKMVAIDEDMAPESVHDQLLRDE